MAEALPRAAVVAYSRLVYGKDLNNILHNVTKIEHAARLRYLREADRRALAMSAASVLYAAAILLIVIITVNETVAVLAAAGWR
jgi:hypothetical protein